MAIARSSFRVVPASRHSRLTALWKRPQRGETTLGLILRGGDATGQILDTPLLSSLPPGWVEPTVLRKPASHGPDAPRGISQPAQDDGRGRLQPAARPGCDGPSQRFEPIHGGIGQPTDEHDPFRVQRMGHSRKGRGQRVYGLGHDTMVTNLATSVACEDLGGLQSLALLPDSPLRKNTASDTPGFRNGKAARSGRVRPVTEMRRGVMTAPHDPAIDQQPAADVRSQGQQHHVTQSRRGAGPAFAQKCGLRVVLGEIGNPAEIGDKIWSKRSPCSSWRTPGRRSTVVVSGSMMPRHATPRPIRSVGSSPRTSRMSRSMCSSQASRFGTESHWPRARTEPSEATRHALIRVPPMSRPMASGGIFAEFLSLEPSDLCRAKGLLR